MVQIYNSAANVHTWKGARSVQIYTDAQIYKGAASVYSKVYNYKVQVMRALNFLCLFVRLQTA